MEYRIYTDGAYNPSRRKGGWAAIILSNGNKQTYKGDELNTTSNRMEIMAAIEGLARTPEGAQVTLHSGSQYLIYTMTQGWKRKVNLDLWQKLDDLAAKRAVSWELEARSSTSLPSAGTIVLPEIRNPQHGVARYEVVDTSLRELVGNELAQLPSAMKLPTEKAEWALQIADQSTQVRATMYSSGVLLIQGKATELWDSVCSSVEALLSPQVREIASRFISQSEEQTERFQRLFSPKLVAEAEARARDSLEAAYEFLADYDKRYVASAFCLYLADLPLPDYSAVVMPFSKAFEGYLKKLALHLGLVTQTELDEGFQIGRIFDLTRPQTKAFIAQFALDKGMLKMLEGEWTFSRNFLMHSYPSQATDVKSMSEAALFLGRLADSIKRSHKALVLRQ